MFFKKTIILPNEFPSSREAGSAFGIYSRPLSEQKIREEREAAEQQATLDALNLPIFRLSPTERDVKASNCRDFILVQRGALPSKGEIWDAEIVNEKTGEYYAAPLLKPESKIKSDCLGLRNLIIQNLPSLLEQAGITTISTKSAMVRLPLATLALPIDKILLKEKVNFIRISEEQYNEYRLNMLSLAFDDFLAEKIPFYDPRKQTENLIKYLRDTRADATEGDLLDDLKAILAALPSEENLKLLLDYPGQTSIKTKIYSFVLGLWKEVLPPATEVTGSGFSLVDFTPSDIAFLLGVRKMAEYYLENGKLPDKKLERAIKFTQNILKVLNGAGLAAAGAGASLPRIPISTPRTLTEDGSHKRQAIVMIPEEKESTRPKKHLPPRN